MHARMCGGPGRREDLKREHLRLTREAARVEAAQAAMASEREDIRMALGMERRMLEEAREARRAGECRWLRRGRRGGEGDAYWPPVAHAPMANAAAAKGALLNMLCWWGIGKGGTRRHL